MISMTSTLVEKYDSSKDVKFPVLRQCKSIGNHIVLFSSREKGTVVWSHEDETRYVVGFQSNTWNYDMFENIDSEILLKNKRT